MLRRSRSMQAMPPDQPILGILERKIQDVNWIVTYAVKLLHSQDRQALKYGAIALALAAKCRSGLARYSAALVVHPSDEVRVVVASMAAHAAHGRSTREGSGANHLKSGAPGPPCTLAERPRAAAMRP
jgi:hypothetical protein